MSEKWFLIKESMWIFVIATVSSTLWNNWINLSFGGFQSFTNISNFSNFNKYSISENWIHIKPSHANHRQLTILNFRFELFKFRFETVKLCWWIVYHHQNNTRDCVTFDSSHSKHLQDQVPRKSDKQDLSVEMEISLCCRLSNPTHGTLSTTLRHSQLILSIAFFSFIPSSCHDAREITKRASFGNKTKIH